MDDEKYASAMQIILHAGNAKSAALMAIDAAAEGDFVEAGNRLGEASDEMARAHRYQFALTQAEADGSPVELNIILIHAEDHLTMAIMSIDFAERFIALYKSQAKTAKQS